MSLSTNTFVETNKDRLLSELKDFLRIPSISTLPEHVPDIQRAAEFVAASLRAAKMEHVEVIKTAGHPLIYADWLHAPGKPTVLCYGHYDVQPPDPLDEWVTPPFEPTVRDGNIYARGSADDKGQMYSHIKAVEALFAVNGKLPVNVKFLIEGEEEVSGAAIAKYVAENPAKLKSDVALVSDTELYAEGIPTLCIGLRGLIYTEIEARGPAKDLHSGMYGGAAPNAIFGLVELLSKLKDAQGHINIPGIYDDVAPPTPEEKHSWSTLPFDEKEFLKVEVGSTQLTGEPGFTVLERVWARPTLEVHGIVGGFVAPGAKTVIPAKATAKVSIRLVPNQDPLKIIAAYKKGSRRLHAGGNSDRGEDTGLRTPDQRESRSSGDSHRRESVFRRAGTRDGVHSQRRLDSDCGRFQEAPGHSHHPDGIRTSRRWIAFAQREIQARELLRRDHDHCPLP